MEIRPNICYRFPNVLTVEGAVNYIERMALEEIHPRFENLCWKMMDSTVEYFTRSVHSGSESGENVEIQMVAYL